MQQKNGSKCIYYMHKAPKYFGNYLKSNSQYFDLKSPLKDHARRNDIIRQTNIRSKIIKKYVFIMIAYQ
jgi:hypothetical protein